MNLFDRVIISADSEFFPFLPLVTKAWKKLWNCKITVALLNNDLSNLEPLPYCDDVIVYPFYDYIPKDNQAKIIRCLAAMREEYSNEVLFISDADMVPLARWYLEERLPCRKENELLIFNSHQFYDCEKVNNICKFPSNYLTTEGRNWVEIYNPNSIENLYESWRGMRVYDDYEDFFKSPFSHESQLRVLVNKWTGIKTYVPALIFPFSDRILDRSSWKINNDRLYSKYYYAAHVSRPYNERELQPLVKYIENL